MLVHGWSMLQRDDGFSCRRLISEGALGPFGAVMMPPLLDDDLGFLYVVENLSVEQFVPEPGDEAHSRTLLAVGRGTRD